MTRADVSKILNYWLTLGEADWRAVGNLFRSKNYVQALFFVHLSIEKLLKAMIVRATRDHAPYGHDLPYLLGKTEVAAPDQIVKILRVITTFNMESRYPDENLSFFKKADRAYTKTWIKNGELARKWSRQQSEKK